MPGYVIHIAIANEYIRKNKDIKNSKKFLKGTFKPDFTKNKEKTHYGKTDTLNSLMKFLKEKEKRINKDFYKAYFLHLYADYLLYSVYFPNVPLHDDFDKTTKYVVEKYKVKLPFKLRKYGKYFEGNPKSLSYDFLDKYINELTDESIENIIKK